MRSLRWAVAVLLVWGGVVLWSAWRGKDRPAPAGRPPVPGVVVLCFDTMRGDALEVGPDRPQRMPALAAFAERATTFADASASAPWTAPSFLALLAGLRPTQNATADYTLRPRAPTLAGRLREAGWHTAAATGGAWVSPANGLAQGFDEFSTDFDLAPEREVRAWAAKRPAGKPFFLFLHTYACHDPYGAEAQRLLPKNQPSVAATALAEEVREEHRRAGDVTPASLRRLLLAGLLDAGARPAFQRVLPAPLLAELYAKTLRWVDDGFARDPERAQVEATLRRAYDDALAHADDVFRRTREALAPHLPAGTVFVVVSDHGEAFGEHGTLLHGRWLHDVMLRVPLLVEAPGVLPPGRVVRGSCGVIDLVPTILALAGVPPPAGLEGRSLLPLARGEAAGHPVVAEESRATSADSFSTALASVRTEAAKLVIEFAPGRGILRESLFDLAADPGEASPLPAGDLARHGRPFVEAVERLRAEVRCKAERSARLADVVPACAEGPGR